MLPPIPPLAASEVIRGAVAISDVIIKKVLASSPLYDYEPNESVISAWATTTFTINENTGAVEGRL
ncbi:MAG TPA: hypothetical protein DF296_10305 [Candidatus Margulisbacteria bacterium]|nr:MAG: hypothetical protein A2X43_00835 [Candidatus Margulisbacteria bacterium GWD2_39_127]OGI02376.1 MAG: hypothetical protein A2X42_09485 [Candidatus Margulisbacteria bacterium GWF2_38_17]OGI08509.1 MAG: hypothetical protein A2X41_07275 [Candidatus Margulisbacteria bacterium GWE2_39_32]HAR63418.1 hypothetical protein [Candidatus Margulisiibacteriota bacterium]HCT85577.1 hypothetical protein [Candidatus Margulisiibacteriota bacterium]